MDPSQILNIFSNSTQGKLYRICTLAAIAALLASLFNAPIAVDIHNLRTMSFLLIILGAIIWIIDERRHNYWMNVNSDDYSPYCDFTPKMAESAYLKEYNRLNVVYIVIGVIVIFIFS